MAAMPIYGKSFKNTLLLNHLADCLESWYVDLAGVGREGACSTKFILRQIQISSHRLWNGKNLKRVFSGAVTLSDIEMHWN